MAEKYRTATSNAGTRIHAVSEEDYDDGIFSFRTMCGYFVYRCSRKQEFLEGEDDTNCRHCSAAIRRKRSTT